MISKRLIECAKYTKNFNMLADIGCDHAYLAIYSVLNRYVNRAICYDINEGPINQAKQNIIKNGLNDLIEAYVANGISSLDSRCDVISICGMGGSLIYDIINENFHMLKNVKRLILEPNVDSHMVRKLTKLGLKIVCEEMIEDKKHIYEIIIMEKGYSNLSDLDIKYGPFMLKEKSDLFIKKYKSRLMNLKNNYKNIVDIKMKEKIEKEILELEEIIKK